MFHAWLTTLEAEHGMEIKRINLAGVNTNWNPILNTVRQPGIALVEMYPDAGVPNAFVRVDVLRLGLERAMAFRDSYRAQSDFINMVPILKITKPGSVERVFYEDRYGIDNVQLLLMTQQQTNDLEQLIQGY